MTRIIHYTPKVTSANTQYREIQPDDMAWLQQQFLKYLSLMAERDLNPDSDNQWILNQFWHKRNSKLHKGRIEGHYRQNTPCSFVGGIVNNLVFGTQRDLTDKQMEDIEYVSMALGTFLPLEDVRFQVRVI